MTDTARSRPDLAVTRDAGQPDAEERDCTIAFRRGDRKLAVAVVRRDLEGLRAEVELESIIGASFRERDSTRRSA